MIMVARPGDGNSAASVARALKEEKGQARTEGLEVGATNCECHAAGRLRPRAAHGHYVVHLKPRNTTLRGRLGSDPVKVTRGTASPPCNRCIAVLAAEWLDRRNER